MNRSILVPVAPPPLPFDAIVIADVVAASSFSQFVSIHLSTYKKIKMAAMNVKGETIV